MSYEILKNKIILVTGGSGLLGSEIIKNIHEKGGIPINLDISITTDISERQIQCDITNPTSVLETLERILDYYGKIDGLVNNAYPRTKDWGTKFEDLSINSIETNIKFQLSTYIYLCQKVIKYMLNENSGSIVNIASIYGVVGNDYKIYEGTNINPPAIYSAIKGGVINFTRHLAAKYGNNNIRVNCVSPGGIFDNQDPIFLKNYTNRVPMGRMGNPDDIAPSVSFLLSNEAKYITGQNLIIDGGWCAI